MTAWERLLRHRVAPLAIEPVLNADEGKHVQLQEERDLLIHRLELLRAEYEQLVAENDEMRREARQSEPVEMRRLRRTAEQDRRNCVVLADALAMSEGRRHVGGFLALANRQTAEQAAAVLLTRVRAAVDEVFSIRKGPSQ